MILQDLQAPAAVSRTFVGQQPHAPVGSVRHGMGSGLGVAKGHRVSGQQSRAAQLSWALGLGSGFLVPPCDPSAIQIETGLCVSCQYVQIAPGSVSLTPLYFLVLYRP